MDPVKKNARARGRAIVFVDESGLSEHPHQVRTWVPRGQTPVLQMHFNWKPLSAIAEAATWPFYFRLCPGTFKNAQVVEFLGHLPRQLRRKLLSIWDGLRAHRSWWAQQYVGASRGLLWLAFLPTYAPELYPVEYMRGYCKHHEWPNFCLKACPAAQSGLAVGSNAYNDVQPW